MIIYLPGDILSSRAQVIVNPVNTVGVMGSGLAKAYKDKFPEMFNVYKYLCDNGKLKIGTLWIYKTKYQWILNFPTKEHWRGESKLEYIEAGLQKFVNTYKERKIFSIAFPKLGCGLGGLAWDDVKPLMEHYLNPLPIEVYIYK